MPSSAFDPHEKLRSLLGQVDWKSAKKSELDRICRELQNLGGSWPQDILNAFQPLRDDLTRRMVEATKGLNASLGDSGQLDKAAKEALAQRIATALDSIEAAPHLRFFKQAKDTDAKVRFLWALACVLRAVQDETGPVGRNIQERASPTVSVARRLGQAFFVLSEHGNILNTWHAGRLERYDGTLWRAGKRAAQQFKDELQVRLVSALRAAIIPPAASAGSKVRSKGELELRPWPMSGCPLARAFVDFLTSRTSELGDVGQPTLGECPPHSLRPETLRKLLGRLDAFEIVESTDGKSAPGLVRLRFEGVQKLCYKAVGTKPKASSISSAPPVSADRTAAAAAAVEGRAVGAQRARGSRGGDAVSARKVVADGDTARRAAAKAASSAGAAAVGSKTGGSSVAKAAAPKPPAGPKLVRRRIDWSNGTFLRRVVRRGLTRGDEEWTRKWEDFCRLRRISSDLSNDNPPPKEAVAEFMEQQIASLLKKDWAKELMYKAEGHSDELPPESDTETLPPKSKIAKSAATSSSAAAAVVASHSNEDASGPSASGSGDSAGQESGQKRPASAVASDQGASRDYDSSSYSDSSRSRQRRKKMKKEKKLRKMGMLGYGDYMKGMTPEVMMMNQMMGMSMMMNNPLAMMSMGAMPMTGMGMMASSSKRKDDKAKKERKDVRKDEKPVPPPPPGPPPESPAPAATSTTPAKAMIDADDL